MAFVLKAGDMEDLYAGCSLVAGGGAGDAYLMRLLATAVLERGAGVEVVAPHELPDDAFVVPVAMMGSPTVLAERVPTGQECLAALQMLEGRMGRKAQAVVSAEIAGVNAFFPVLVAAQRRLPLVDADGMGRAFPELQMTTFHCYGVRCAPMALVSDRGERVLLEAEDDHWVEHLARAVTLGMGGLAYIAFYPMTGRQLKETAVLASLSGVLRLGRAVREARRRRIPLSEAVASAAGQSVYASAHPLFEGRVVNVERKATRRFVVGRARVSGTGNLAGHTLTVDFQNEFMVATVDGRVVAMVPDIISLVDAHTGFVVGTEALQPGARVLCLAIGVPEVVRTPAALSVWGPRVFGYDLDYQRVETIASRAAPVPDANACTRTPP